MGIEISREQKLLLSEQLAGQGITDLLNYFYRDYETPPQALLVIVNGSPHAQSRGSDPLGFGDLFRTSYYQYWKKYDWRTLYPKARLKVKIDFKIDHYSGEKRKERK